MTKTIDYGNLMHRAMCGLIQEVLQGVARDGLPGKHHFFITFDTMHFDFGKISPDKNVSHKYKITNHGNAVLNITNVNPSCGCTYTAPEKWSLVAGESTVLEATFNPAGFRGPVRKSLVVISNDPKNPAQTLTFEADVVQEINVKTTSVF